MGIPCKKTWRAEYPAPEQLKGDMPPPKPRRGVLRTGGKFSMIKNLRNWPAEWFSSGTRKTSGGRKTPSIGFARFGMKKVQMSGLKEGGVKRGEKEHRHNVCQTAIHGENQDGELRRIRKNRGDGGGGGTLRNFPTLYRGGKSVSPRDVNNLEKNYSRGAKPYLAMLCKERGYRLDWN